MNSTETKTKSVQERLLARIKRHSGMDNDQIIDAGEHGADASWPGFTYYSDTVAFFKKNRADILELVNEMASDLGENPVDMVARFNCLGGRVAKLAGSARIAEYYPSVSRCLYGGRLTDEDTNVANALAWFALEEIGRWLESQRETA